MNTPLELGLVDYKICSVNEVWSAMLFAAKENPKGAVNTLKLFSPYVDKQLACMCRFDDGPSEPIASLSCRRFAMAQRYTFKEYVEGLGNLNVNCMLQDRTGFLWIGTENGLFRYDGSRFQDFGHRGRTRQHLYKCTP